MDASTRVMYENVTFRLHFLFPRYSAATKCLCRAETTGSHGLSHLDTLNFSALAEEPPHNELELFFFFFLE